MKKVHIGFDLPQPDLIQAWAFACKWLLPNPGTLILMLVLVLVAPALARPGAAPTAASVSTIPYQGRLADAAGQPITARQNMEFRIYDSPTSSTPLWEEFWTGGNSVNVSDGLFSVMLGSINTGLAGVVQGHNELYLGITVGTDSEMEPRVQLGSVPFSMWSLTVADGSVTSAKIASAAITTTHVADGAVTQAKIADDAVGSSKIMDGAVNREKLANGALPYTLSASDHSVVSINTGETATLLSETYHDIPAGDAYISVRLATKHVSGSKMGGAALWVNDVSQAAVPFHGLTTEQVEIFTFSYALQDFEGGDLKLEIKGFSESGGGGSFIFGIGNGDTRFGRYLTAIVGLGK